VLRLRSILGRREGFERPPEVSAARCVLTPLGRGREGPIIDATAEPTAGRSLPDPASPLGQTLAGMQQVDNSFNCRPLPTGAETRPMIVGAFASGNRDTLKSLLSDDTFHAFEAAITARETRGRDAAHRYQGGDLGHHEEAVAPRQRGGHHRCGSCRNQVNVTIGMTACRWRGPTR